MLTQIHVYNIRQVTISNSVFTQGSTDSCSTIITVADLNSFPFPINNTRFIFINNVISNYACYHNAEYTEFIQITSSYDNVTFANNIVANISSSEHYDFNKISFDSQGEV